MVTSQIWASGFEEEAHSDDLILEDHTSWGPATDAKILIFNPQQKSVERRVRIQDQSDLDFEQYVAHGEILRQPKKKKKCCSVS
ncbi:unnamed protein product [Knipowitschia caucasica]|uniref:Uncharacterized protein n=1 Tax=Knipowitschia caucasica TaxID=637954 RepID=A0AAV2LU53_KNICA